MLNLNDREWKEFQLNDLFEIVSGKDIQLENNIGKIPYINSSGNSNGIVQFVKTGKVHVSNCITIARTGTVGATFYQKETCIISGNIRALIPKFKLNSHISNFLVTVLISNFEGRFNYGKILGTERLKKIKLNLPITTDGNADYAFMEAYVKEQETKKNQEYIEYAKKIIDKLEYKEIPSLEEKKWGEFFIGGENGIFTISSGKRLTKADMDSGNTPFIGATDSNNGITNWISTTNSTLDKNVLGVNYNGSVVENFYHPYKCIFTDDVKRLHFKNISDNKYIYLFFKTIILKQKSKYTYGYKFNSKRMERQKILVPICRENEPDYEYMEQYIKNTMHLKLNKYISFIK